MDFWNQREIFIGSFEDFHKLRDILRAENIHSGCKIVSSMYYLYVHKRDFERAQWLLKKVKS